MSPAPTPTTVAPLSPIGLPPKHHHHLMMVIFILVAVMIGALALYIIKWSDLGFETQLIQTDRDRQASSGVLGSIPEADVLDAQINSTDLGSLDAEFESIDSDLGGL